LTSAPLDTLNRPLSDVIQPASTGRSKCRGCARPIAAKTLRFGEALPSSYGEGESLFWFHLPCAACMRPEKLLAAVETGSAEVIPERDFLERAARAGIAHPRVTELTRVERAASGRGRCRSCHELIEKDRLRLALQTFAEGRFTASGTIHVECAEAYLGTADLVDRLQHLQDLDPDLQAELERALAEQRPIPVGDGGTREPAQDSKSH
jgi:hypothetical protein